MSLFESIAKVFIDQQDDKSPSAGRTLKGACDGAHGCFAGGQVAFAFFCTGRIKSQTARIGGTGDGLDAAHGVCIAAGNQLVASDDQADGLGAKGHRTDAVARAVNLHDDAAFGQRVGRGEIEVSVHGASEHGGTIRRRGFPVPEHFVSLCAQAVGKAEVLDGHAAAHGDERIRRNVSKDECSGFLGGIKHMGFKAARRKRGSGFLEFFDHMSASFSEVDTAIIPYSSRDRKGACRLLDEICLRAVDWVTESFGRWYAPWKIRFKRSAIGFRIALIFGPMIRVCSQILANMEKKKEQEAKAKEEAREKERAIAEEAAKAKKAAEAKARKAAKAKKTAEAQAASEAEEAVEAEEAEVREAAQAKEAEAKAAQANEAEAEAGTQAKDAEEKDTAKEDIFLQWFLKEPTAPKNKISFGQKMALLMMRADAFFTGKAFPYLLLMTMLSVCLLAGCGTRALAVMAAFFCLHWLAEAFAQDYEPVCGGVRQRYLASVLLRSGAYLVLLLDYFSAYAADGLQINVVLQGAMILTVALHVLSYIGLTAFNKRQPLFLRVLCGLLGIVPALACAAGIALGASTVARGVVIALSGILRATGVSLSFLSWEIGTNGELSGGRLRYFRVWQNLTMMIGFFMMLLGAWLSAQ